MPGEPGRAPPPTAVEVWPSVAPFGEAGRISVSIIVLAFLCSSAGSTFASPGGKNHTWPPTAQTTGLDQVSDPGIAARSSEPDIRCGRTSRGRAVPVIDGPGACVRAEFGIPVIGVAKTGFRISTHAVPILRGPPRAGVTAAGMRRGDAAELVRLMADRSGYLTRCAAPISSPARAKAALQLSHQRQAKDAGGQASDRGMGSKRGAPGSR